MTRKRRYVISAAVLAACVGIALGVLAMLPPHPGVSKANYDRIEVGMPRAAVEAILGKPAEEVGRFASHWAADDGTWISILFRDDEVKETRFYESHETILDKFRRWLGLSK